MAIIIPSKYIYDIDDNKVIDNEVDKIEVRAQNGSNLENYQEPVLRGKIDLEKSSENIDRQYSTTITFDSCNGHTVNTEGQLQNARVAAQLQIGIGYIVIKELTIPKKQQNGLITKIHTLQDGNGNNNIQYSLNAEVQIWKNIDAIYKPSEKKIVHSEEAIDKNVPETSTIYSYKDLYYQGFTRYIKNGAGTTLLKYEVVNNIIKISSSISGEPRIIWETGTDGWTKGYATAENDIEVTEKLIFTENEIEEKDDCYIIRNLKICGEIEAWLAYASVVAEPNVDISQMNDIRGETIKGTKILMTPKSLELTVLGDTISLNLEDKTILVGNGEHLYSFSGNELMQTDNNESVDKIYQKVIDNWEEGKEIATLKCALADYEGYSQFKTTVTLLSELENRYYSFEYTPKLQLEDILIFSNGVRVSIYRKLIQATGTSWLAYRINWATENVFLPINVGESAEVTVYRNLNNNGLTFKLGDIVEPYVYGADGKDKPMALKKDGTAKQFKVISVGINNNNGITQDIVIQEI